MPKLIKNGEVVDNDWIVIDKETALADALEQGDRLIVPARMWVEEKKALQESGKEIGVWLDSDEDPAALADNIGELQLIALNFPMFKDGRAYSLATILRQQYKFKGDLRAIGDVLRDQLFYMRSCGFTSFALSDQVKVDEALAAFKDFTDHYQSTVIDPTPLFRRR